MTAVVDTGAPRTFVNWPGARALGLGETHPALARGSSAAGYGGQKTATYSYVAKAFTLAGRTISPVTLRVVDFPVFGTLGYADKPAVILGMDLFDQMPVAIDRGAKRVCVPRR